MSDLNLQNPVFATYVVAATILILKAIAMSWLTVVRMVQANGGFRAPEDLRKTPLNPSPNPGQLQPNESVERIRRIHLNDLENIPFFLVAGLLYVLTEPSLLRSVPDGAGPRRARNAVDGRISHLDLHDRKHARRGMQRGVCLVHSIEFSPARNAAEKQAGVSALRHVL